MSSEYHGIEEARANLGPLVNAVIHNGVDVVLTRHRRPVARLVRYREESMSTDVAHGTPDTCVNCGHDIRMQRVLLGEPVEPTWRSDLDDSIQCKRPGQLHTPRSTSTVLLATVATAGSITDRHQISVDETRGGTVIGTPFARDLTQDEVDAGEWNAMLASAGWTVTSEWVDHSGYWTADVERADITARMDLPRVAAIVIARARETSGLTAPEFDYQISVHGVGGIYGPLGNESYPLANAHMPEVEPGQDNRMDEREANWLRLWEALQPEMEAYAQKCRSRQYANWSNAAQTRGRRIQYAD